MKLKLIRHSREQKITIPAGTSIKHFVETVVPLVRSIYGLPVITQNLKDVLLERNPQFDEIRSSEHVIKVAGLASDSTRANIRAHLPKGYDLTRLVMSHDAVAIHAACLLVRGCDFFQGQMVLLQNGSMFYDFNLSGPDEKRGLSKEGHIADMCTALCYTNETQ
jgi:hypothetical protein